MVTKIISLLTAPYKYLYMMLNECSNYNSDAARKKCRTKQRSKEEFKKNNIPTAEGLVFINPVRAFNFVRKTGFPVVIKPNFGGYSRGSFFPINNNKELFKACLLSKFYWPKTVIERYLEGKNYRVVVAYNKVVALIQRFPPFVTGDGISTISELVDKENRIREKMRLYPVIHPILKNDEVVYHLKKQGLSFDSVPQKNAVVYLHNKIALEPGGVIKQLPLRIISDRNRELLLKINKIFKADVLGIDIIMKQGIEVDFDKQKCIFLEVNSRPYLKMHLFPRYGRRVDVDKIIRELRK